LKTYWYRPLHLSPSFQAGLVTLVDFSRRTALWIVLGALVGSAGLLAYTATNLTLDTNPLNLLDPTLPFRSLKHDFETAFPQLSDVVVVIVDSESTSDAEEVAKALVVQLERHSELFQDIYHPGTGPFFDSAGFLYLDTAELWDLDKHLTQWEPFLGTLAQDTSLRGLFSVLGLAVKNLKDTDDHQPLIQVFDQISDTIHAEITHQPHSAFWQDAMMGRMGPGRNQNRQIVLVKPRFDFSHLQAADSPLRVLRSLATQLTEQHQVQIRLTGSSAIEEEERQTLATGASVAAVLSVIFVCLILFWGLRSPQLVGSILVTLAISLIWTAGFATFAIGTLNFISATAPVLLIGLGVDFGIQFGMRYREERKRAGTHASALRQTAFGVGVPMTLSAFAAAFSFFSFLPTSYRGVAELGLIAGGGMFIALLANVTLFPALLTLLPLQPVPAQPPGQLSKRLSRFLVTYPRPILWAAIFLTVASVALLPKARFDFNPLNLKDPSTEAVATFLDLLGDPDTTPYTIQIVAKDLPTARELEHRLNGLQEVEKTVTLASYVPKDQQEKLALIDQMAFVLQPILMPGASMTKPTVEEQRQAFHDFLAQLVHLDTTRSDSVFVASLGRLSGLMTVFQKNLKNDALLEEFEKRLLGDLPQNIERLQRLLSAQLVTLNDLPPNLKSRYLASDGRARLEVFPSQDMSQNQALREFVQAVQSIAPTAIGTPVALIGAGDAVVAACLQALGLALLMAALLLYVLLQSFRDTVVVVFPLLVTMILTVAATVVLHLPLNMANVIILPLILGLGMAFGIYLLLRHRQGMSIERVLISSSSRAVLYSALTTMSSFGTLSVSSHRGMSSVGSLLTLALGIAMLCSLFLLPALLSFTETKGSRESSEVSSGNNVAE